MAWVCIAAALASAGVHAWTRASQIRMSAVDTQWSTAWSCWAAWIGEPLTTAAAFVNILSLPAGLGTESPGSSALRLAHGAGAGPPAPFMTQNKAIKQLDYVP